MLLSKTQQENNINILRILEFADVISQMQIDLAKFKMSYPDRTDRIETAYNRIQQLMNCLDYFYKFYCVADLYRKKYYRNEQEKIELLLEIKQEREKNERLLDEYQQNRDIL